MHCVETERHYERLMWRTAHDFFLPCLAVVWVSLVEEEAEEREEKEVREEGGVKTRTMLLPGPPPSFVA